MQTTTKTPASTRRSALMHVLFSCCLLNGRVFGADQLVPVTVWSRGRCPCSAQFAFDFNATVWSNAELRSSIDFKQPWSAVAHADNTTSCFHGAKECRYEMWMLCAQQQGIEKAFPWELCVDGPCDNHFIPAPYNHPCKTQYENPDNITLMKMCATETGIDFDELESCATSTLGSDLLLEDAHAFKRLYGVQGLPIVEVNGKIISKPGICHMYRSQMDTVLNAICNAITKEPKPTACQTQEALQNPVV